MYEDSFLDSFMESHIGGWTGYEDQYYDEGYCDDEREDFHADEAIGYVDPFEDGPYLD